MFIKLKNILSYLHYLIFWVMKNQESAQLFDLIIIVTVQNFIKYLHFIITTIIILITVILYDILSKII